jgi:hypothetical protein
VPRFPSGARILFGTPRSCSASWIEVPCDAHLICVVEGLNARTVLDGSPVRIYDVR